MELHSIQVRQESSQEQAGDASSCAATILTCYACKRILPAICPNQKNVLFEGGNRKNPAQRHILNNHPRQVNAQCDGEHDCVKLINTRAQEKKFISHEVQSS